MDALSAKMMEAEQAMEAEAMPDINPSGLLAAEASATLVVDRIVEKGGDHLYKKYITKKSFEFARDMATEHATCAVYLSNPSHEQSDSENDWELEDAPQPLGGDNWIRRKIPRPPPPAPLEHVVEEEPKPEGVVFRHRATVAHIRHPIPRRQTNASSGNSDSQNSSVSGASRTGTYSSKNSKGADYRAGAPVVWNRRDDRAPGPGVRPLRDHRAWNIREDFVPDEDEDKYRAAKVRDDRMRMQLAEEERQRQLDEEAAEAAEERRRNADAMDTRPRTYDADGQIIWIREPDPESLPPATTIFDIDIEAKENDLRVSVPNWMSLPAKKQPPPLKEDSTHVSPKSSRKGLWSKRSQRLKKDQDDFTDTFYKPDYMQPPVINTMKVESGVVLACMGQTKPGSREQRGNRMTRREYLQRTKFLVDADDKAKSDGDEGSSTSKLEGTQKTERPASAPGIMSGSEAKGQKGKSPDPMDLYSYVSSQVAAETAKSEVKEMAQQAGPRQPLMFFAGSTEDNSKAPKVPAWSVRNNASCRALKIDARPPRFHKPNLGACLRDGPIQPPLGATMGHGLLKTKESYYFPTGTPSAGGADPSSPQSSKPPATPGSLPRPGSAPALRRGHHWDAAAPSITATPTSAAGGGSPSPFAERPSSAKRPISASRQTSASQPNLHSGVGNRMRPTSASGARGVGARRPAWNAGA